MAVTFTDQASREWQVAVTPWERDEVLEITGVDIYDIVDEDDGKSTKLLLRFESDDAFLVDVMWGICKEQCEEKEVNERLFKKHLYGQSLNDALEAVMKAYAVFFRSPVKRAMVEKLLAAMQAAAAKQQEAANLMGLHCDEIIQQEMDKVKVKSLVKTSMNSAGMQQPRSDLNGKKKAKKRGSTQHANS